jgi:site-specific recombinase XerC
MVIHGENLTTVQHMLDHTSLQPTAIYARLNVEALAGALQRHADRLYRRPHAVRTRLYEAVSEAFSTH